WLGRPEDRTRLGRFVQTVLDGGLWEVIWRELDQNISIVFGNRPLTILAICGVLTVDYVLARPIRAALTSPGGGEFAWLSAGNPISVMGGTPRCSNLVWWHWPWRSGWVWRSTTPGSPSLRSVCLSGYRC